MALAPVLVVACRESQAMECHRRPNRPAPQMVTERRIENRAQVFSGHTLV
jgi:hypothetical protein